MKSLFQKLSGTVRGIGDAVCRFPLTVVCLAGAAGILSYMVAMVGLPSVFIQKLLYTFLFGAMLSAATQSFCERFKIVQKKRVVVYIVAAALTAGYYLLIGYAPEIKAEVVVRTLVAVFAMLCAFLWIPSYGGRGDFNAIALTHFKNGFISILYGAVIWGGLAAIIATIDALLFNIDSDVYVYMSILIWVLFAPLHYLSQLPRLNSEQKEDKEAMEHAAICPKFLNILLSYIFIPLVAAYTTVLAAYFIKILITQKWPSGQLGPMVLAYSGAGLIIYILASRWENKFAVAYQKIFPKALIFVVILQLVSVGIRLNAYGITESRYYVVLFGVFSLVCGVVLSFFHKRRNGIIALLAMGFALFSIVPPVDAFTISRVSQTGRLETILRSEEMLTDGKLIPKPDATDETKKEVTNIVAYLDGRGYLPYIKWMPTDFKPYEQMEETFGFRAFYSSADDENKYYNAHLDREQTIDITGFDILLSPELNWNLKGQDQQKKSYEFTIHGVEYKMEIIKVSDFDERIAVIGPDGRELVTTQLYEQAKSMVGVSDNGAKSSKPLQEMTFDTEQNGYALRVVFENISITQGKDEGAHYGVSVFLGVPK